LTENAPPDKTFNMEELADDRLSRVPNGPSNLRRNTRQNSRQENQDDDMVIPCEFCEMDIPLTVYLDHVDNCPFGAGAQNNRNNDSSSSNLHTRSSIPVINNLHSPANDTTFSVPAPLTTHDLDLEGSQVMLPCEFCEDVFPGDIILQHQSVCPANGTVTPRVMTPAAGASRSSANTARSSAYDRTRAKRRQDPAPAPIDFVNDNTFASQSTTDNSSDSYFRYARDSPAVDKYSPAVNRFNEAVTRPPGQRKASARGADKMAAGGSLAAERPPSSSTQRARARLNQLLQEDLPNNTIAEAARGARGARKPLKQGVLEKKPPGFICSAHKEALEDEAKSNERKTHVSSRTVLTQMERAGSRPSRTRPEESPSAARPRSRQRADNLFSPELRLKPDHNPKTKKR